MSDDDVSELPRSLRSLWGLGERSPRGPKPGLSIGAIVGAAIELADAEGLAAVSMARVAKGLGFTTMSLYRYLDSKDELLDLMVDRAYGPPPDLPGIGEDWRADLERWAWAELAGIRVHPWVLDVPVSGPPMGPNQLAWLDRGLHALERTHLTEQEKASIVLVLSGFVRNEAQLIIDLAEGMRRAVESGSPPPMWGALLRRLIDPETYPALWRATEAGTFEDDPDGYGERDFDFGLQRVLDGIAALVHEREPVPASAPAAKPRKARAKKPTPR